MRRSAFFKNNWIAVALIAPQLLIIFVFFYWPTSQALFWAFTLQQPWTGENTWVGLQNFRHLITDPVYWNSVQVSLIFAAATTVLAMGFALILALFVDRQLRGFRGIRVGIILPYAIAAPAIGLAFRYVFDPNAGIMAYINRLEEGLWSPEVNGSHALILVIVAAAWKQISYNFIFLLAGLQSIPRSLTEAAAMDGSGALRRMRDVQLPLMAPTFFFVLVINITDSFVDSFGIVDTTTQGGPARATQLMVYKIYMDGFRGNDYSGAAAQSIILMVLVMMLTFFQFRYIERRVHYT